MFNIFFTKFVSDFFFSKFFRCINKQNFILDEDVLNGSNIKGINTASTGLNHIDLNYCEQNNIDNYSKEFRDLKEK